MTTPRKNRRLSLAPGDLNESLGAISAAESSDDEAGKERRVRGRSRRRSRSQSRRRQSLSNSIQSPGRRREERPARIKEAKTDEELAQLYSATLELASRNKINRSNAWALRLIDYLPEIALPAGCAANGVDFTRAGTVMDASVRIYSTRVDALHNESEDLRKDLQSLRKRRNEDAEAAPGEAAEKKKRRGGRGASARTLAAERKVTLSEQQLRSAATLSADPMFAKMAAAFDESSASGMLLNHVRIGLGCSALFDAKDTVFAADDEAAPRDFSRVHALSFCVRDWMHEQERPEEVEKEESSQQEKPSAEPSEEEQVSPMDVTGELARCEEAEAEEAWLPCRRDVARVAVLSCRSAGVWPHEPPLQRNEVRSLCVPLDHMEALVRRCASRHVHRLPASLDMDELDMDRVGIEAMIVGDNRDPIDLEGAAAQYEMPEMEMPEIDMSDMNTLDDMPHANWEEADPITLPDGDLPINEHSDTDSDTDVEHVRTEHVHTEHMHTDRALAASLRMAASRLSIESLNEELAACDPHELVNFNQVVMPRHWHFARPVPRRADRTAAAAARKKRRNNDEFDFSRPVKPESVLKPARQRTRLSDSTLLDWDKEYHQQGTDSGVSYDTFAAMGFTFVDPDEAEIDVLKRLAEAVIVASQRAGTDADNDDADGFYDNGGSLPAFDDYNQLADEEAPDMPEIDMDDSQQQQQQQQHQPPFSVPQFESIGSQVDMMQLSSQMGALQGDARPLALIAAPRRARLVPIQYALSAKRINMRALKRGCWRLMAKRRDSPLPVNEDLDDDDVNMSDEIRRVNALRAEKEPALRDYLQLLRVQQASDDKKQEQAQGVLDERHMGSFQAVLSSLDNTLQQRQLRHVSVPLCFISVLHLANERQLALKPRDSALGDFVITEQLTASDQAAADKNAA